MKHLMICAQVIPKYHDNLSPGYKGGPQNAYSEKVGHLAQPADPPPPRKLGRQKKKKKFDVYFAF